MVIETTTDFEPSGQNPKQFLNFQCEKEKIGGKVQEEGRS